MLSSGIRIKNIACIKYGHFLCAIGPEVHIYDAIHDCKDFVSIIDVPLVWLICPMQLYCRTVQICDRQIAPCPVCREFFASNRLHGACLTLNISVRREYWVAEPAAGTVYLRPLMSPALRAPPLLGKTPSPRGGRHTMPAAVKGVNRGRNRRATSGAECPPTPRCEIKVTAEYSRACAKGSQSSCLSA